MDYNHDASCLATGGSDMFIRLYDEQTKSEIAKMKDLGDLYPGHSNRVFCVKWNPGNHNLIASGGWDKTI